MTKKTTAAVIVVEKINADLLPLLKPIASLSIDPKNTRRHGESDLQALAKSISIHGQQKPIVVTPSGKVIAGNGTLQACRDILKWTNIAAITFDGDTESAQTAFAISDNRMAELSSWNFDELRDAIDGLPDDLVGQLGFSEKEIAALLDDGSGSSKEVDVSSHTREIGEVKPATVVCPKCGFEFDE